MEEERGQHGLGRVGAGQEEASPLETKQFLYGVVGGLPMGHMNFLEIIFFLINEHRGKETASGDEVQMIHSRAFPVRKLGRRASESVAF